MLIYAPNPDTAGVHLGVHFRNGVGETDDPTALEYFQRAGYGIGTPVAPGFVSTVPPRGNEPYEVWAGKAWKAARADREKLDELEAAAGAARRDAGARAIHEARQAFDSADRAVSHAWASFDAAVDQGLAAAFTAYVTWRLARVTASVRYRAMEDARSRAGETVMVIDNYQDGDFVWSFDRAVEEVLRVRMLVARTRTQTGVTS